MSDVTRVLAQIEAGDPAAAELLLPLVYDELRRLAAIWLAQEKPGLTLQPTALVHEAYMRLVNSSNAPHWNGQGHFFAAAAEAMRRILVDQARRKQAEKHGGGRSRVDLDEYRLFKVDSLAESQRILAVHEALTALEAESPRRAQLVKLRFFAGMTLDEAAAVLGIAEATVKRDWAAARVWLYRWLSKA